MHFVFCEYQDHLESFWPDTEMGSWDWTRVRWTPSCWGSSGHTQFPECAPHLYSGWNLKIEWTRQTVVQPSPAALTNRASNEGYPEVREDFTITEKAPTRAYSWLKAATTAFTFKTLLWHYAKRTLTARSLTVKLGPRRNYHKGRAVWLA